MSPKFLARSAITLFTSLIFSWIGAALDHNNWWGWSSTIWGIVGLFIGYGLAWMLNQWVDGG